MNTDLIGLIPKPQTISFRSEPCVLSQDDTLSARGDGAAAVAELLADYLRPSTGYAWPVLDGDGGIIALESDGPALPDDAGFVDERYRLTVDARCVRLRAPNATGLARGIQTLRQLLPPAILAATPRQEEWIVPGIEIEDYPRFRWRGQHLDVARHFFSVEDVCRFIDLLAFHRLNVCHLHLTEDQGWRIEIKAHPRLTEVGSRREETLIGHESERPRRYDGRPYGGFYTREDIRRIVAFAERRHIVLVPEIDMPGHMMAAIAAYPELGNRGERIGVRCHWGISQNVLNVEASTIEFMKTVLTEVMDLFPGRFIHIGGDEAPKHEWSESKRAQERMAELGLANENELQSWFIRQMNEHIRAAGRRLIGWDETLEGGLADGAAVMSWRGEEGGLAATSQGHDVVMAANAWTYFDHYQAEPKREEPLAIGGILTTEHVYASDPIPAAMPETHRRHVLGAQGQLWSEYITSRDHLDYMGFPRISALSEVLWLEPGRRNYVNFLARLGRHRRGLDVLGVKAHPRP
ncbi:MAG: beta-N-acetylhexosaminidase [Opitutales bacterium]